jgi:alkaline phosphatase
MTRRPSRWLSLAGTSAIAAAVALTSAVPAAAADPTGPKNVIVLIGDGMGYNHIDAASLYEHGTTYAQVDVDPLAGTIRHLPGTASQVFQSFPVQVAMSTHSANGRAEYDPTKAWADFDWISEGATDSAAAGTALATGVKTDNGILGMDPAGNTVKNVAERAAELDKATGVVTSVQFSHATPASWGAHNASRNDLHGISDEMIAGPLDVIMGAGHPYFDDDHQAIGTGRFDYLSEGAWNRLADGQTPFTLIEDKAEFEALAAGGDVPEQVFGLAQVASTLQQARSGGAEGQLPFEVAQNDVASLATMTQGALNVLEQDDDGLFLMVEGGAIDWTGHANETTRNIEETIEFNRAVETVVDWVEAESSWDETLVIVTADHETGYLDGSRSDPTWTPITGAKGQLPDEAWFSGNHTNQLVPLFAKGAGSELLASYATGTDPVRGAYLDNVDVARVAFESWGREDAPEAGEIPLTATVPQAGEVEGSLTMSVADFGEGVALGGGANVGDRLRFGGALPTVSVTDSRSNAQAGTGGWTVSGQAADLSTGSQVLRAQHLGWTPGLLTTRPGVAPGSPVATVLGGGAGLATPATLATATSDGRLGTTDLTAELALEVPVDTRAGEYAGSLTVSLFRGPSPPPGAPAPPAGGRGALAPCSPATSPATRWRPPCRAPPPRDAVGRPPPSPSPLPWRCPPPGRPPRSRPPRASRRPPPRPPPAPPGPWSPPPPTAPTAGCRSGTPSTPAPRSPSTSRSPTSPTTRRPSRCTPATGSSPPTGSSTCHRPGPRPRAPGPGSRSATRPARSPNPVRSTASRCRPRRR